MKAFLRSFWLILAFPMLAPALRADVSVSNDVENSILTVTIGEYIEEWTGGSNWRFETNYFSVDLYYGDVFEAADQLEEGTSYEYFYSATYWVDSENRTYLEPEEEWYSESETFGPDFGDWSPGCADFWEDEFYVASRDVEWWHHHYEISNLGNIRNESWELEVQTEQSWEQGCRSLNWEYFEYVVEDWHEESVSPDCYDYWEDESFQQEQVMARTVRAGWRNDRDGEVSYEDYTDREYNYSWQTGCRPLNWEWIYAVIEDWHEVSTSPDCYDYWEDEGFWQTHYEEQRVVEGWRNDRDGEMLDYITEYGEYDTWEQGCQPLNWRIEDVFQYETVLSDWSPDPCYQPAGQGFTQNRTLRHHYFAYWTNDRGDWDFAYAWQNDVGDSRSATGTGTCLVPAVSGGSASGTFGAPFSYSISATNSPTGYGASGLPAGLSVSGNTISGTPAAVGSFAVTLSAWNSNGTGTADLSLSIGKAAQAAVSLSGPPGSVSLNTPVTLTPAGGSGTGLFEWSGHASGTSSGAISVTFTSTGTKTVSVKRLGDSNYLDSNSASVQFEVTNTPAAPTITSHPASQTVNAGTNVTFSVVATGNPTPSYQWRKDGVDIPGATGSSYTIANAQASHAGGYTVFVSNSAGSVASATATLAINAVPAFTTHPQNRIVAAGQSAMFSVSATGTPAPSYQWQRMPSGGSWSNLSNGGSYSGVSTGTLTVSGTTTGMNGDQFRCVATSIAGSANSNAAMLTIGGNDANNQNQLNIHLP